VLAYLALLPARAFAADAAEVANNRTHLPSCAELAALVMNDRSVNDRQGALEHDRDKNDRKVLEATSTIVPANGPHAAYCKLTLMQAPSINIAVGLPLSDIDGGIGGLQGAWKGKIDDIGIGGNAGLLSDMTSATDIGYVGAVTDTGHSVAWCNAINPSTGKPNAQKDCGLAGGGFFLDTDNEPRWDVYGMYIEDGILAQALWGLEAAKVYYGREAKWNYWTGCSGGGRQGMYLAQRYPQLFDGILVGAPAIGINRFIEAEQWPQVMAYTLPGHILAPQKSRAATAAAIAACGSDYGAGLGIIGEPRRCKFDARALICKGKKSAVTTCLTAQEAQVIDSIWRGPRGSKEEVLWGGIPKGTTFDILLPEGGAKFNNLVTTWVMNSTHQDPNFDARRITPANFAADFEKSYYMYENLARDWGTDSTNLDSARDHGTKILLYHASSDPLALAFNSYNYVTRVFDRYGVPETQKFLRTFFYPGNNHCGGGTGPQIDARQLFDVLQNWLENGVAPDYVVASGTANGNTRISRPICKYPDEAVYNGVGSNLDAKNFHCITHDEEPADLATASRTDHDHPESDQSITDTIVQ
jgi:hypothetical protein